MGIDHVGSTDGLAVADLDPPGRPAPESRRRAARLLACLLVPAALLVAVGLALLWPAATERHAADPGYGPGASFVEATVDTVTISSCSAEANPGSTVQPSARAAESCPGVTATVQEGAEQGRQVIVDVPGTFDQTDVGRGDRILLVAFPLDDGLTAYAFVDFAREMPIGLLAAVYILVVVAVARMRGLRALVGLAFAGLVIAVFTVPALLGGEDALLVGLVSAAAIMFVVLYVTHGVSVRTTTALLGTLFGLGVTAVLATWATSAAHLTGLTDEDDTTLRSVAGSVSLSGLVLCGIIIAGLGVLNDVTITQSSAVWELHALSPELPPRRLFASAMRIGRDHIASTVYTIAFAYAGAALPVLLLVEVYAQSWRQSFFGGALAEEVVRTLVGSVGLVLAVPLTTLVAVVLVTASRRRGFDATAPSVE